MISKPQPGEFLPYQGVYIDAVGNAEVPAILQELRDSTYAFFTSIPEEKASYAYAPGKWTIKETLGHLIDTERVFAYRLLCFARGEQQGLPGFEQDDYVLNSHANDRTLQDLADEFRIVRESSIYLLRHLKKDEEAIIGKANNNPISIRSLAYMIPGHELHHLRILKERYLVGLGIQI
ncbi:DinB family protein [Chitinophaga ginsengisoli]|uniref:DinB family protein n=1 Tax=Chitinophaga ginsengisoli TaxID=363837 RepID=A0A2P8FUP7_9BACT|nr:DinB family protein [Chitinophaga ginsengisoli]PSL25444.1 DinB family protein [Chitinophaga ginsengisoli]